MKAGKSKDRHRMRRFLIYHAIIVVAKGKRSETLAEIHLAERGSCRANREKEESRLVVFRKRGEKIARAVRSRRVVGA